MCEEGLVQYVSSAHQILIYLYLPVYNSDNMTTNMVDTPQRHQQRIEGRKTT